VIGWALASPRRIALVLVGVAISVAAGLLAVRGVDLDRTAVVLRTADLSWLVIALGVLAVQIVVRAARWRLLLPADGPERVAVARIVPVALVGYLGNAVLPARLGEALRGVLLARRESLPTAQTLGSVILERVLDTRVLAVVGIAAAIAIGVPDWIVRVAGIGVVVSLAGLAALSAAPRLLARIRIGRVERLIETVARFVHGAGVGRRPRRIAAAIGLCLVAWALDAVLYWLAARAIGLELAPAGAVLVSAVTVLSTAVPSAPGYVGTFELAAVAATGALGIDPSVGLAFALVAHAVALLPIACAGAVALAFLGRDVRLASAEPAVLRGRHA